MRKVLFLSTLALLAGFAIWLALGDPAPPTKPSAQRAAQIADWPEAKPAPKMAAPTPAAEPAPAAPVAAAPAPAEPVSAAPRPAAPTPAAPSPEAAPPAAPAPAEAPIADLPIAADAPDAAPPTGRVDKEAVRSAIQSARPVVADCYQQALAGNAELAGTLTVKFTVVSKDDEGRIRDAEIEGEGIGNPFLEMCVLKALGDTSFPVPDGGGEVVVRYPFKLAPR